MAKTARLAVDLEPEFLERVKDATNAFAGRGMTITSLVEAALERELRRLERQWGPIPKRRGRVRRGRPAGPRTLR